MTKDLPSTYETAFAYALLAALFAYVTALAYVVASFASIISVFEYCPKSEIAEAVTVGTLAGA